MACWDRPHLPVLAWPASHPSSRRAGTAGQGKPSRKHFGPARPFVRVFIFGTEFDRDLIKGEFVATYHIKVISWVDSVTSDPHAIVK